MQATKRRILEASPIMGQTQNLTIEGKEVPTQEVLSGSRRLQLLRGKNDRGVTGLFFSGSGYSVTR